jgi:hypothetical protein
MGNGQEARGKRQEARRGVSLCEEHDASSEEARPSSVSLALCGAIRWF